jgi:DNA-binding protein HU-beta
MTKTDLLKNVRAKTEVTQATAEKVVNAVFASIKEVLEKGESFALVGFGTLKVAERAARTGRNPRTGVAIAIPAKKVVRFLPGKALRDTLNPKVEKPAEPAPKKKPTPKSKKK